MNAISSPMMSPLPLPLEPVEITPTGELDLEPGLASRGRDPLERLLGLLRELVDRDREVDIGESDRWFCDSSSDFRNV